MDSCILFSIVVGLTIRSCDSATLPPDVNVLPKVKTTYVPIIPDIEYHEAMDKLKDLWVAQLGYCTSLVVAAEDIRQVTRHPIRQIRWILGDTKDRIEEQISVLTKLPRENTDEMKQALDDDLIFQQRKSLDGFEKCLNDHYEFEEKDENEKFFRETLESARDDLLRRQKEIKEMVKKKQR